MFRVTSYDEYQGSRLGINFITLNGRLHATSIYLGRRFHLVLGGGPNFRRLWLDLSLDHKMYQRDPDIGLVCRRCKEGSSAARPYCRGKIIERMGT